MEFSVLPLRAVAFQALFLLVAIAIEGQIFRTLLPLSPRLAMQYAAILNLLVAVVGWFFFFGLEVVLPVSLRLDLIAFILFNRWSDAAVLWGILVGFLTFFGSFTIKFFGLTTLLPLVISGEPLPAITTRLGQARPKLSRRLIDNEPAPNYVNYAGAALNANAASYSAILLLLFIRYLVIEAPAAVL